MTRLALAACLAICGCETGVAPTDAVAGLWVALPHQVSPLVFREGITETRVDAVTATVLTLDGGPGELRMCRSQIRDPDIDPTQVDPCACTSAQPSDCVAGAMRLQDALVPATAVEVSFRHDDARADLVGVMAWYPAGTHARLALHLVRLEDDPTRRPDPAFGLQGPLWSGADRLNWYTQAASTPPP